MTEHAGSEPLRIAVIIGSTREGRAGAAIARWFLTHADQRDDLDIDVIDLLDADLPINHPAAPTPAITAWRKRIDRADGFVLVTPEYNRSAPAVLKNAIDHAREEWYAKPVGFVTYGGAARGLRAAESLQGVFNELHAVTLRDNVGIALFDGAVDDSGWVIDGAAGPAAKNMLDRLGWWASALRTARVVHPYAA